AILSTGGTFKILRDNRIPAVEISQYTGFPEMLDGRVKTLHPKIYAGLLARRDDKDHQAALEEHEIPPIDMVVVNLYPFEAAVSRTGVSIDEAIENIDIGGPSLIRAAAKNHSHVAVVTDVADYPRIQQTLEASGGELPAELLKELAVKAYTHTARYDNLISKWFRRTYDLDDPEDKMLTLQFQWVDKLRYGENPHQHAAVYRDLSGPDLCVATAEKLNGKALSYNNLLDADAALNLLREFVDPAAVVIKHNNPCGAGSDPDSLVAAFNKAYEGDPLSAYGSVVGLNWKVTSEVAAAIAQPGRFVELILAPEFDDDALEILKTRQKWGKNVRILATGPLPPMQTLPYRELRSITGGLLVQDKDIELFGGELRIVTGRKPDAGELSNLQFAWRLVKHGRSNSIAIARDNMLTGLGAGQMSRVDATRIAIEKSGARTQGAVLASDAFFPFRDSIDEIAAAGISAVIQPGGSIRDKEVIQAANDNDIAMVFTGLRHFRH
ncbi:bifunctional phosphoribosylaminoimidazolecarboxamide formyltransferase/IMP cyclohydrolase, partial [Planctomycetota bacterium]